MSMPPPLQAEPLSYATEFVDTRRPGSIIAIGVLSIVFAVVFGLSAGFAILMAIGAAAGTATATSTSTTSTSGGYMSTTIVSPAVGSTATPTNAPGNAAAGGLGNRSRELLISSIDQRRALSPERREILAAYLAKSGQAIDARLRDAREANDVWPLVRDVTRNAAGEDVIEFTTGELVLDDSTAHFTQIDEPRDVNNTNQGSLSSTTTRRKLVISPTATAWQSVTGCVNAVLALVLLVAGILMLSSKPIARKLHLWWAWIKIVASLGTAVATYFFWMEFMTQAITANGQANTAVAANTAAIVMGTLPALVAMLYPIAVLITMRSQKLKNYLSSMN